MKKHSLFGLILLPNRFQVEQHVSNMIRISCGSCCLLLPTILAVVLSVIFVLLSRGVNPKGGPYHYANHIGRITQKYLQKLEVTRYRYETSKLPRGAVVKFAHMTDFHHDHGEDFLMPSFIIDQLMDALKHEKPDYALLTGDYVHWDPDLSAKAVSSLVIKNITKLVPNGVYGVLGNHDLLLQGWKHSVVHTLQTLGGVKILDNAFVELPEGILLIGLGDYPNKNAGNDVFAPQQVVDDLIRAGVDTNAMPTIVLEHTPDAAECVFLHQKGTCSNLPVDIMLSGHTHGVSLSHHY